MGNQAMSPAAERIHALLDDSSFVEVGARITARTTDFNMAEKKAASDGVITGYGTIDGGLVYVYAQDASVLGGSMGEMHAKKIAALYDMAIKMGAPIIGLVDCSGIRVEEACDALYGFGRLYKKQALASGVIPQISAIFGTCGGGMAVSGAIADFVLMEETKGRLFVTAPNAVSGNKDEGISAAKEQAKNGVVDFTGTEDEVLCEIRRLVAMLPANNEDNDAYDECTDELNRDVSGIEGLDAAEALRLLSDNGVFVETKKNYSCDVVTGFVKLNGLTVGCIANKQPLVTAKGCDKAEALLRFCDAFELPVLTLADVEGYKRCPQNEKLIARAAGRLTYAYANASVPLVTVVKRALGTAGLCFGTKALGADMVYAWEQADIGVMDATEAAKILYADALDAADDRAALLREKAAAFEKTQNSAAAAAARGYVDDIIAAAETRQRVIAALEMLFTKRVLRPQKKHGTV